VEGTLGAEDVPAAVFPLAVVHAEDFREGLLSALRVDTPDSVVATGPQVPPGFLGGHLDLVDDLWRPAHRDMVAAIARIGRTRLVARLRVTAVVAPLHIPVTAKVTLPQGISHDQEAIPRVVPQAVCTTDQVEAAPHSGQVRQALEPDGLVLTADLVVGTQANLEVVRSRIKGTTTRLPVVDEDSRETEAGVIVAESDE